MQSFSFPVSGPRRCLRIRRQPLASPQPSGGPAQRLAGAWSRKDILHRRFIGGTGRLANLKPAESSRQVETLTSATPSPQPSPYSLVGIRRRPRLRSASGLPHWCALHERSDC